MLVLGLGINFINQQELGKELSAPLSPNSLKRTQIQDINENLPHPLSQTVYIMETTASLKKKKRILGSRAYKKPNLQKNPSKEEVSM